MLTLDTKTSLYAEDMGLQVPMVLEHDYIHKNDFLGRLLDWYTSFGVTIKHTHKVLNLVPGIVSGTKRDCTALHVQLCSDFTTQLHVQCGVPA